MDQAKSWINKQLKDLKTRLNYVNSVTNTNNVHDDNTEVNITVNEDAFLLPENQLQIEIKARVFDEEIDDFKYQPQHPLYLSTCYDEYSRNYCTVNIGKGLTSSVDLIKLHDVAVKSKDDEVHSNKTDDEFSLISSPSPLSLPANTSSSIVLQSYCPTLRDWYSTFRYQTTDANLHLVSGKVNTDTNILIKIMKCSVKQKCFEPIFGSAAIYTMVDDDLHRITESFHFDATPKAVRHQYAECYVNNKGEKLSVKGSKKDDFQGSCINIADGSGSQEHFHMFMATIPEDLKKRELYLVVQLSKVLSSDADKAVLPYVPRSGGLSTADAAKHQEACERLSSYRQPIGIGVLRFTDDSGRISGTNMSYKMEGDYNTVEMGVTLFCQRVILSDVQIGQMIRDLHPIDGTNPYTRMETLDVDMRVMLIDLGRDEQMLHKLPEYQSKQLSMRYSTHVRSMKSPDIEPTVADSSPFFPLIIPAQIQSDGSQLMYQKDYSTLDRWGDATHRIEDSKKPIVSFAVRHLMLLLPLPPSPASIVHNATSGVAVKPPVGSPGGPLDFHQITRTARTTVDNSIYIYPIQLDRFKNRNLVLKIQLVEFKKLLPYPALLTCPFTVLRSIYNTSCITGPIFTSEAYTRMSYHTKNPYLNDEFKLRLPDVLDGRHWLRFTVVHIHVKPTDKRGSILGSIGMKASVEKEDRPFSEVGHGFLALMLNGEALLRDDEHVVNIHSCRDELSRSKGDHVNPVAKLPPTSGSGSGGVTESSKLFEGQVRVRSRALSSLVSNDKRIQNLFHVMPVPYGALPSTIMSNAIATTLLMTGTMKPPADLALATATQEVMKVPSSAISKHFYVIMRQLIRTLVAGRGIFDPQCSSPYKHILSRSSAFLALLQVMGKIANDDAAGSKSSPAHAKDTLSLGKQFLHAYVDFLFDEEVSVVLMYDEDEKAVAEQAKADKRRSLHLEGSLFSPVSYIDMKKVDDGDIVKALNVDFTSAENDDSPERTRSADGNKPFSPYSAASNIDEEATVSADVSVSDSILSNNRGQSYAEAFGVHLPAAGSRVSLRSSLDNAKESTVTPSNEDNISSDDDEEEDTSIASSNVSQSEPLADAMKPPQGESDGVELDFGNVLKKLVSAYTADDDTTASMVESNTTWNDLEQSYDIPLEAFIDDVDPAKMRRKSEPNYRRNSELTAVPILSPLEHIPNNAVRFEDDLEKDFPDFLSPKEAKAAQKSDSRKSWGIFITDKLWISGQLEQFDVAAANALKRGGANTTPGHPSHLDSSKSTISIKHIVDIANHVALQAEKIVIEAMLDQALSDICHEVRSITSMQSTNDNISLHPLEILPSEEQILMDSHFHIIKKMPRADDAKNNSSSSSSASSLTRGGGKSPFDANRVWFSSVRRGDTVDPNDLLLLSTSDDAVVPSSTSGPSKYRSRAVESEVIIEPIRPNYDTLEGHRHRIARISDASDPSVLRSTQWWPCLYEVLVFQWGAVLAVTLSALKLIKSENMRSMIDGYPFETLLKKQCTESNPLSTRSLLIEHCPILLKIVFKSLSLRISRDMLRPPVYLDAQFMAALENLVMLLGVESASLYSGLNRSRDMISSLAHFFRSLFALVCPYQVIKVIRSYFKATRKCRRVEEAELRLRMIEEIGWFDHLVAVNFPYSVDAPLWAIRANPLLDAELFGRHESMQIIAAYTTTGIRGDTNPLPYTLCHVLIEEIVKSYKQIELKVRETSLEVLRDLLVRHAYDARYQSVLAQQRVVCMYLPLLNEFLKEKSRLASLRYDCSERREVLSIALYLMHGLPECVLRDWIRGLFAVPDAVEKLTGELIGSATKETLQSIQAARGGSSTFLSSYSSKKVLSLKSYKLLSNSSLKAYIPPILCTQMPVVDLIAMLHMVLDTFEMPRPVTAQYVAHAQAAHHVTIDESENVSQVLAPRIILEGSSSDSQSITPAVRLDGTMSSGSNSNNNSGNSGLALTFYNNLERRLQNKKAVAAGGVGSRRGGSSDPSSGSMNLSKDGPDERPWVGHARKMAGIAAGQTNNFKFDRYVVKDSINVATQKAAADCLCSTASRIVINIVSMLIEVCPSLIPDSIGITGAATDAFTFILRDSNVDESMLVGIDNLPLVYFKRLLTTVILHGLHCNQHDSAIVMMFDLATRIIQNFGAKVFFVAVEDSLQDWVRISFRHAASTTATVSTTACNFIMYLLRGSFHFLGSVSLVSTTILAVINDVVDTILDTAGSQMIIRTHSDEDRALAGLDAAIESMKATAQRNINPSDTTHHDMRCPKQGTGAKSAFCKSIVDLMNSLQVILLAHSDLRRYTGHPIGFDFFGSNMLDGPWDQRNSALMNAIRTKRKTISPDSGKQMPILSGFHLEEIMVHLLRAADVYDCFKLPRFHMFWLENLAMLHKRRAESAEIRWRIFKLCENLGDTWRYCWSPRPPLAWTSRACIHPDYQLKQMLQQTVPAIALNAQSVKDAISIHHQSRPLHDHPSSIYGDRNFYKVLISALDGKVFRPWEDYDQYVKHLELTLDEAIKGYMSSNLVHLAERTSYRLMHLYRLLKQPDNVQKEYLGISESIRSVAEKGITASIAIGTFYRVLYEGLGAPIYLRGKEFIYRNASQVHVKEFQDQVVLHLKSVVAEGVVVSILQNINADTDLSNNKTAYIVMNTVTKVMHKATKVSVRALNYQMKHTVKRDRPSSFPKIREIETLEALNQVKTFQYSAPFTLGGKSHSKTINEQWLRITTVHVDHCFPYVMTRQEVTRREVRVFSPIQVAILDIEERIDSMENELEKPATAPGDCNDLMRIIQGTVLPQVNAGVGEVAKVFLTIGSGGSRDRMSGDWRSKKSDDSSITTSPQVTTDDNNELTVKLKLVLIDFMSYSKLLIQKARKVLVDRAAVETPPPQSSLGSSLTIDRQQSDADAMQAQFNRDKLVMWQTEMEKGFDALMHQLLPYLNDLADTDAFQPLR